MSRPLAYWAAWLLFSLLTMAVAMLYMSAAFVDGQYIPVSNDSFYHARRIIDAATSLRGFYQFDTLIHVPEGSWINWPWGYDFLLAQALRVALWLRPEMQPMKFLAYVPVFWVFINVGLLTLIARQVRLGAAPAALGLLAFSLLPLTQNLHGLGLIDHHFIELTFVLLTVLCGLRLFASQSDKDAVALGMVLGLSVAFHNGLFILQVPVLATVFLLWLRGTPTRSRGLLIVAGSLLLSTIIIALPSAALHAGQFEFWTLSWFHIYVALASALVLSFMALRTFSRLNMALLTTIGIALLLPMLARVLVGAAFVTGELDIIANITEAQSPLSRLGTAAGLEWITALYGWLIALVPVLILVYLYHLFVDRRREDVFLSVAIIFGLLLLLAQYRLHPFGSWAIIIGSLLAIERLRQARHASTLVTSAVTLALLALVLQPPLRNQLFVRAPPGLDRDYAATRSLYPGLAAACRQAPGNVLSTPDDGHPIRYHTDCGVLVNNFLMTPLHAEKLQEQRRYLAMSAAEFSLQQEFRYIFVRVGDVFYSTDDGVQPTPVDILQANTPALFFELAFATSAPPGYRLIDEVRVTDERDFAFARTFELIGNSGD